MNNMCDFALLRIDVEPKTALLLKNICSGQCHVTSLKLEVKNLEALKLACQRLGLQFMEGQRRYEWYGHYVGSTPLPQGFGVDDLGKCTHAIKAPGADYEIGVQRWGDGSYKLLYDSWAAGGLEQVLGRDLNRLRQGYGVSAAILEAQRQGYSSWEEQLEDGATKIHISVEA
jgi:hypothetical protein